jgi:hypothetical protein
VRATSNSNFPTKNRHTKPPTELPSTSGNTRAIPEVSCGHKHTALVRSNHVQTTCKLRSNPVQTAQTPLLHTNQVKPTFKPPLNHSRQMQTVRAMSVNQATTHPSCVWPLCRVNQLCVFPRPGVKPENGLIDAIVYVSFIVHAQFQIGAEVFWYFGGPSTTETRVNTVLFGNAKQISRWHAQKNVQPPPQSRTLV